MQRVRNQMIGDYLTGKIDRATLLKAATAGVAVAALPGSVSAAAGLQGNGGPVISYPYFPATTGTYTPETVPQIVGNILTWAYVEVTAVTFILSTPSLVTSLGLTGLPLQFLQAFNVEMQSHIDFWSGLVPAAAPTTETFTIDPRLVPGPKEALSLFEVAASVRVALMLAAVREFAELGYPLLAKYAAQTEGMYAEERAIARTLQALAGVPTAVPPNNKAFETDLFLYTRDAVVALQALGFIGGTGVKVTYPGRDAALSAAGSTAANVIQRAPNNASTSVRITGPGSFTGERT